MKPSRHLRGLLSGFVVTMVLGASSVVHAVQQCDVASQAGMSLKNGAATLRHVYNPDEETVTIQFAVKARAWVAFGFDQGGDMEDSYVVMGLPDEAETADQVARYYLPFRSEVDIAPSDVGLDLRDVSLIQTDEDETILTFTQPLVDDGIPSVSSTEPNTFIYAWGFANAFPGYHQQRGTSSENDTPQLVLSTCNPTATTPSPTPMPTGMPTADNRAPGLVQPFSNSVQLQYNLLLNYQGDTEAETLSVELIFEGQAWLGIGVSDDGSMVDAAAVIGLPTDNSVTKYALSLRDERGVVPMSEEFQQTLLEKSIEQNDTHTVLRYTRNFDDDGDYVVDVNPATGTLRFIYAYGASNSWGVHVGKGDVTVDIASGNADVFTGGDTESKWKAHGMLMALAWGVFVPIGIGASVLRDSLPLPEGAWFKIHMLSNLTAVIMTVIGASLAISAINEEQGGNAEHFTGGGHHKLGLVIFVCAILQVASGMLRPHAPTQHKTKDRHRDENGQEEEEEANQPPASQTGGGKKSTARYGWEIQHRLLGAVVLSLAWANCTTGIDLLDVRYPSDANLVVVFWAIAGSLVAFVLIGFAYQRLSR